jgi:hypothetical protein
MWVSSRVTGNSWLLINNFRGQLDAKLLEEGEVSAVRAFGLTGFQLVDVSLRCSEAVRELILGKAVLGAESADERPEVFGCSDECLHGSFPPHARDYA